MPFRSADAPYLPEHAVVVRLHEQVCVSGVQFDNGEFGVLRLDDAAAPQPSIFASLRPGAPPILAVRHSSAQRLRFSIFRVLQAGLTVYEGDAVADPGRTTQVPLENEFEAIALAGFRFDVPGPQPTIRREDKSAWRDARLVDVELERPALGTIRYEGEELVLASDDALLLERNTVWSVVEAVPKEGETRRAKRIVRRPHPGCLLQLRMDSEGNVWAKNCSSMRVNFTARWAHGNLGFLSRGIPTVLSPGETDHWTAQRLLVTNIRFEPHVPPPPPAPVPTLDEELEQAHFLFAFSILGGVRQLQLAETNRTLIRDQLTSLSTNRPLGGMSLDFWAERARLTLYGGGWGDPTRRTAPAVGATISQFGARLSYDVLRSARSSVFLGGGLESVSIGLTGCPATPDGFINTYPGACAEDVILYGSAVGWPAELGGEYRLPLKRESLASFAMLIGYRASYTFGMADGDWETSRGQKLTGGPAFNASGLQALVSIGLGMF